MENKNKTVYRTGRTFKEEDRIDTYIPVKNIRQHIDELLEKRKGELPVDFKPFVFYNYDGGFLEIYWKNDPCYTTSCENKHLELMKDFKTHEVVGVKIHGVHLLLGLKELPNADV